MIYWQIFLAFFIPGILGYGGGPASIPLVENEVVGRYEWMTSTEFSELLAIANTLPGPIATKMAGYVGYAQGGVLGSIVGIFATAAPSLILMIVLLPAFNRGANGCSYLQLFFRFNRNHWSMANDFDSSFELSFVRKVESSSSLCHCRGNGVRCNIFIIK